MTVLAVKMGVISKLTTMARVVVIAGIAKSVFFSSPKAMTKSRRLISSSSIASTAVFDVCSDIVSLSNPRP